MDLKRTIRHMFMTRWRISSSFPVRSLMAIEQAVRESHQRHVGQVRFAVEGALHSLALLKGKSARERAIEVFSDLRVWDTEHNNGVLVYLLLADRDVEIVADRGIHARVSAEEWEAICREMEAEFRRGQYESGAIGGIRRVTGLLEKHFPASQSEREELPSSPTVL
ncbi:TPM domain-containing protein [Burkholderia sp. M6-3]